MTEDAAGSTGARLRQVRAGRTQAEFAKLLGIGRTTLIRYEAGSRVPDADVLAQLWAVFKVDAQWLLTGVSADHPAAPLSPGEARLLSLYRACDPACQAHLTVTAELLAARSRGRG